MRAPIRSTPPAADGFFMPAEWAEHAACWMAFPCRDAAHRGFIQEARTAYANVAHAIAEFEPVNMVVNEEDEAAARRYLSGDIRLLPLPIDDAWMRDSGPTFVINANGETAAIDWAFNAWGNKYTPFDKDDAIAGKIIDHLSLPRYLAPLIMEGGSIHTDGNGILLTTEQCLLHRNRNPRLEKPEIENLLRAYLGVDKIIWLAGDARDDETDGHIDNIACFIGNGRVLAMESDDDTMLSENIRRLRAAPAFEVICLPRPKVTEDGIDLLASYINFYFANGGIIMPSFNNAADATAHAIIAELFPERRVVQVLATDIIRGGGGIHCITQQQPQPIPSAG